MRFIGFFNANSPPVTVEVDITGTGYLDAWIDWNGDGDFLDAQEKLVDSQFVATGTQRYLVSPPGFAALGLKKRPVPYQHDWRSLLNRDGDRW